MKHEEEVIEEVGAFGGVGCVSEWGVVVYQPHGEKELTTIALDTPDGRRHELEPDEALALAELLQSAPTRFAAVIQVLVADKEDEDE